MSNNSTKNSRKADFDDEEPPQKKLKSGEPEPSQSLDEKSDKALPSTEQPAVTKLKTDDVTSLDNKKPDDAPDSSKPRSEEPAAKKIKTEATSLIQTLDDAPASSKPSVEETAEVSVQKKTEQPKRPKPIPKPGKNLLYGKYLKGSLL